MRKWLIPLFCFLFFISTTSIFGQVTSKGKPKVVRVTRTLPNAPITIVKVLYQGKPVQSGVPFDAEDNWLQEVSVVVKNVSSTGIVLVNIFGDLPESGTGTTTSPRVPVANTAGRKPDAAMYSPFTGQRKPEDTSEAIKLEPAGELTVPLMSKDYYEDFNSLISAKQPLSSITNCEISVATVYFADGTKWSHSYWQPDTTKPGRYEPMSFDDWQEKQQTR